ncbi:hypothetical protein [Hydrogenophaga sp. MI9]|uniref:hypothetical protein n=1 Tax=Hydrogenophaga sp. MI9 TaxID=3453719 RepID=UPI003EEF7477
MFLRHSLKVALACILTACNGQKTLEPAELATMYAQPLAPPDKPLRVFYIGHSLVNKDVPMMLEQLAGTGHDHRSQLGWGASLRSHWEPDVPVNGFDVENAHPRYQDARQAVDSGRFDVLVLAESVEIKDAIKYQQSPKYIRQWARAARTANPQTRVYLYELWHELNDAKGWLERLDEDLALYWEGVLLAQGMAHGDTGGPVYVIPAGQVMARLVREVESRGGVDRLRSREDLFNVNDKGERDMIHLSPLGNYLVALTHYAVLYHRPPPTEPFDVQLVDGTPWKPISPELARLMSQVIWSVVTSYPKTGVAQSKP